MLRARAAVRERREELGLSPATVAAEVLTPDDYTRFEDGRLWPHDHVRAVLEHRLRWPDGLIGRVRSGVAIPEEELTDLPSPTVRAALALDAAEVELRAIAVRIDQLPDPRDDRFTPQVTPLLAQLRRLDHLGTAAVRATPGRPQVAAALAAVRQVRAELLSHAGRSPGATLGQRLGSVRHRGRLSVAEVATATGVTVTYLDTVEREEPPPVGALEVLEPFVTVVDARLPVID